MTDSVKTFVLALMIFSQNLNAENWVELVRANDGSVVFYIETETAKKQKNLVYAWTLVDMLVPVGGTLSSKVYTEYDCEKDRRRVLAAMLYKENMGQGDSNYFNSKEEWTYLIPGSLDRGVFDFVCSYFD